MTKLRTRVGRWAVAAAAIAVVALVLTAMATLSAPTDSVKPAGGEAAKLEPIAGTKLSRVTLTAEAAQRLGIQTTTVRDGQIGGKPKLVIPYSAVVYDPAGVTWTYTNPEPLVFVRHRITVDSIQGDSAALAEGPPPGTTVVSVGAAELYGTELRVGGDG